MDRGPDGCQFRPQSKVTISQPGNGRNLTGFITSNSAPTAVLALLISVFFISIDRGLNRQGKSGLGVGHRDGGWLSPDEGSRK